MARSPRHIGKLESRSPYGPRVARNAHPLVRQLFRRMDDLQMSEEDAALRSGVDRSALSNWRHGRRTPRLVCIEAALGAVGLTLEARP